MTYNAQKISQESQVNPEESRRQREMRKQERKQVDQEDKEAEGNRKPREEAGQKVSKYLTFVDALFIDKRSPTIFFQDLTRVLSRVGEDKKEAESEMEIGEYFTFACMSLIDRK